MLIDAVILVPDTNIFLEFRFFTDVDWSGLAHARTAYLAITSPVIRELDKWKYDRGRRGERARKVQSRLRAMFRSGALLEAEVRPGTRAILWLDDAPGSSAAMSEDDRLLAMIPEIMKGSPGVPVRLVTDDTAPLFKAAQRGHDVLEMPSDLKMPPEPSEERREIARLRRDVDALTSRFPVLDLWVAMPGDLAKEATLQIFVPRTPTLASYLAVYKSHLGKLHEWSKARGRTARLQFVIENTGHAEAEGTRARIHFPDPIEEVVDRPEAPPGGPVPPRDPTLSPIAEALNSMTTGAAALPHLLPRTPRTGPIIRRMGSVSVTFPDVDLRHGYRYNLDPIWVVLPGSAH